MAKKMMISIHDDVLFEIFLGISWRLIFQCRLVSKQWLSILSNPIFITSWINANDFKPWTRIVHDANVSVNDYVQFSSSHAQSAVPKFDGLLSLDFMRSKLAHPEKKLYILAASNNGLLLCSTTKHHHTKYHVCNPLLKTSVSFSAPTRKVIVLLGLICTTSSMIGYKVIRIPQFSTGKTNFKIELYSSDSDKWITYQVSCGGGQDVTMPKCLQRCRVIQRDGVLYWSEGQGNNRIVALDIGNNKFEEDVDSCNYQCKVIALPEKVQQRGDNCLAVFEGSIACIHCDKGVGRKTNIWVLQDDNTSSNGWVHHSSYPMHYVSSYSIVRPLAFDSMSQSVVTSVVHGGSFNVCTHNIKTKRVGMDMVSSNQKISPRSIKAFVLPLLPTPL